MLNTTFIPADLLKHFFPESEKFTVFLFGSGLINHTWIVKGAEKDYILQKINTEVFKHPAAIDHNLRQVAAYLSRHCPGYLFMSPMPATDNKTLIDAGSSDFYRLFPFVKGSRSYTVVTAKALAFEAAAQFGKFTRLLSGFNIEKLKITLPDFHNLTLRYQQFEQSLLTAKPARHQLAAGYIKELQSYKNIAVIYKAILQNPAFIKRVTHHDTKISNVLFDAGNKGLCVIDLDTVMPGYFISDVGDMMRTYLSPADEEETDLSKIGVREDYFEAIVSGYLGQMQGELTSAEKEHFVYAGRFMTFMQALRFMTDYLNNDVYYGARYETHNLNRAINQLTLLNEITSKEKRLNTVVEKCLLMNKQ